MGKDMIESLYFWAVVMSENINCLELHWRMFRSFEDEDPRPSKPESHPDKKEQRNDIIQPVIKAAQTDHLSSQ